MSSGLDHADGRCVACDTLCHGLGLSGDTRILDGIAVTGAQPSYSLHPRRTRPSARIWLMREDGEKRRLQQAEGLSEGRSQMCDYSLHSVKSRPAKVGDKLTTRDFGTCTRGFSASEDASVVVCLRPGTELSFADEVRCLPIGLLPWRGKVIKHKTAIFRQINNEKVHAHHDALEFPDGQIVLLTFLLEDQQATVLQLPAEPKTVSEAEAQRRATYVG
jgi:hypothetical protein